MVGRNGGMQENMENATVFWVLCLWLGRARRSVKDNKKQTVDSADDMGASIGIHSSFQFPASLQQFEP